MVPTEHSLRALTSLASTLNEKSEELNQLIVDLEKRLAESRVGVTCWLDPEVAFYQIAPTGRRSGAFSCFVLGYTKLGSSWRLAVKQVRITEGFFEAHDPDTHYTNVEDVGDPVPLLKAPRAVRVEAAGNIDALLLELTTKVQGFVDTIDRAKALVKEGP